MGIKRLNRSRLYNVEKEGLDVKELIGASDMMKKVFTEFPELPKNYLLSLGTLEPRKNLKRLDWVLSCTYFDHFQSCGLCSYF